MLFKITPNNKNGSLGGTGKDIIKVVQKTSSGCKYDP